MWPAWWAPRAVHMRQQGARVGSDGVAPLGKAWTFCFKCIVKLLATVWQDLDSHFKA